jgi:hypothetical protein
MFTKMIEPALAFILFKTFSKCHSRICRKPHGTGLVAPYAPNNRYGFCELFLSKKHSSRDTGGEAVRNYPLARLKSSNPNAGKPLFYYCIVRRLLLYT